MWRLVSRSKTLKSWFLFEGTEDGYKVTKIFANRWTAKIWATLHHVNFSEG